MGNRSFYTISLFDSPNTERERVYLFTRGISHCNIVHTYIVLI